MRVLITGALGFVGSHVTKRLLQDGHDVLAMDNKAPGPEREDAEAYLEAAAQSSPGLFASFWADAKDAGDEFFRKRDVVIHLAAVTSARLSVERPLETMEANVLGTLNVLEACRRNDVAKVIFPSTLAVYGKPERLPFDEEHPTKPTNPYALSKLAGEHLVRMYSELHSMKGLVLRFSNIYGLRGSTVIPSLLGRIYRREPVRIFGGDQMDDYLHVSDAVEAYLLALRHRSSGLWNIGSGCKASLNELVGMMREILGLNFDVAVEPYRKGELIVTCECPVLNFKKARAELGYLPKVMLADGIRRLAGEMGLPLG